MHDDRGDRGEGFDRVTRETRVTGASKDVEGGGEAEEGVRRRRRRRRKRCHHSGTDEQRTRKDRAAKPMQGPWKAEMSNFNPQNDRCDTLTGQQYAPRTPFFQLNKVGWDPFWEGLIIWILRSIAKKESFRFTFEM